MLKPKYNITKSSSGIENMLLDFQGALPHPAFGDSPFFLATKGPQGIPESGDIAAGHI
jgi:hypothetical protein